MKKIAFSLILCGALLTSCMTTKTPVGNFMSQTGSTVTYDKGKQFWLFWGMVPMGRQHVSTPSSGDCQVVTKFKFTDALIFTLTGGIVSSYSIKIETKKDADLIEGGNKPD